MTLEEFNSLSAAEAREVLTPCVSIAQWVNEVSAARPFSTVEQAVEYATRASADWQNEAITFALSQHPRIGERVQGDSKEAALSRAEQATLGLGELQTAQALLQGNQLYEQRFNRVFLIRAKGRTPAEILSHLHRRLQNSDSQEREETAEQLQQITLLRFKELFH
ncbi:OHCU decarboxylase [Rouxiella silvae]|uniref:2-oxo-4-hydroxy-4-carboxy-5-ureidoimidazoline decarboxylase n=1 Tax=Rouxiella silvae TaxID=1646373 RepID=A0ABX3U4Q6_9GAMM|nr:2-oxo-4-hydroxy-4-carboxy-5-ureidoimidazoline decarboxylase [Rouxiella silvae]ORJ22288.1 OHCU decarboxylase [Rouxiella silvae]